MIFFVYTVPIVLIILVLFYGERFFNKNRSKRIIFLSLLNILFVAYCFGVYEICKYASNIRINGKIKIYINSLLQYNEILNLSRSVSHFSFSTEYFPYYLLSLLGIIVLFICVLVYLYFSFHKKITKYVVLVFFLLCMILIFPLFDNFLDYYNNYKFYIEIKRINSIIVGSNLRGVKLAIFREKLNDAASRFNTPYYNDETPISRLKMLQADIVRWINPEIENSVTLPEKSMK